MKKKNIHIRKLIYSFLGLFCFSLILTSCDKGFDQINTDELAINHIEPVLVLNNQIQSQPSSAIYGFLLYDVAIVQQVVAPYGQTLAGGNFNQDNQFGWVANYWDYGSINQLTDTINRTEGEDRYHNTHHMARIMKAFRGLKNTDTMGDVPYTEAGRAISDDILYPKYDPQEVIYNTALSEILSATQALDASKRIDLDVLYAGDIAKWKRFGYSLLLRYGMRLSEVAENTAREYVEAAFNGGVFQSNDDNAMLLRNDDYSMSMSGTFNNNERGNFYLTDVFVNYLQDTNDPRLESIAVRYVGADSQGDQDARANASRAAADQVGLPMGYDQTTVDEAIADAGVASLYDFSQVNRDLMVDEQAPDFLITYAQTQLLLAEAAERGWIGGSGVDYFAAGVRGGLEQMAMHHPDMAIPQNEIDTFVAERRAAYLSGNPYEEIHNQYWVAGFIINPREVFANWRRTNYPTLQPNPYPDQEISGDFIRRRTYPQGELNDNGENVQEAISRQGWSGNNYDDRVWWDTQGYNP